MATLARAQVYTFQGRLGRDPEYKALDSGAEVSSVRIAVDHPKKRSKNDEEHQPDWIKVEVWFNRASEFMDKFKKGDEIIVRGRVSTNTWDDKTGEKRFEIVCKAISFEKVERERKGMGNSAWVSGEVSEEDVPF